MDIELTNPEYFPPDAPISPVEALKQEKQYKVSMAYLNRFEKARDNWGINRVGRFLQRNFNIDLTNK